MTFQHAAGYAGDLLATDAYEVLAGDANSMLVDVRTAVEWTYVGTPNLDSLGKTVIFLEWQSYPSMKIDGDFPPRLEAMLEAVRVEKSTSLLFLCRSGVRSRSAAVAMTSAGWPRCFNISDGFEGPLDSLRHRGIVGGWKARGLPWAQT